MYFACGVRLTGGVGAWPAEPSSVLVALGGFGRHFPAAGDGGSLIPTGWPLRKINYSI